MNVQFRAFITIVGLFFAVPALAAWDTIVEGRQLCGLDERVCFSGSIRMERNQKVIVISGRIIRAPGEGTATFVFVGTNPLNEHVYYSKSQPIKGNRSEIIDIKFGPPYSNETLWQLENIVFEAAEQ